MCAYDFFGAEHLPFGSDMPYDVQLGDLSIGKPILYVKDYYER